MKKVTISEIKRHIKKSKKQNRPVNFLGLVENRELADGVEDLFKVVTETGQVWYNWIKGNSKLQKMTDEIGG